MPRTYRDSPPSRPATTAPKRPPRKSTSRGWLRKQKRYDSPSVPVLNPRRLAAGAAPAAAGHAKRPAVRRKSTRRWRASHVMALLLLAGALAGMAFVWTAPEFRVYNALIENPRYTTTEQIYQQAGIHGDSIFGIDPERVSAQLEQLPHVRQSDVRLGLPNRVHIRVEERDPLVVYQGNGEDRWADMEGVLAPVLGEQTDLPRLIDEAGMLQVDPLHIDPEVLAAVHQISTSLPQVKAFRYQQPFGLFFLSPEGWRVYLGDASQMTKKLATWEAIRQQLLREKGRVKEVDLRYQRPYWR